MGTRDKVEALQPLVSRLHRGHCWLKTADGPRRLKKAFTTEMLAEHCAGRKAYGLCPITPGESTTSVAVLDLDDHNGLLEWEEMLATAASLAEELTLRGYRPLAFRSSGGSGIHLYVMWEDPQDAYSVRELMKEVLASCELSPGTKGVGAGQVEIFPKQDEVPTDGYGSMFILPFAGQSELLEL